MRYFTRQLYESQQVDSASSFAESQRLWLNTSKAYQSKYCEIKPFLPDGMKAFSEVTLHDGRVKSGTEVGPNTVELLVDATDNPWGPTGWYLVRFMGVKEVDNLPQIVGDEWLFEEVHLHAKAGFEYRVLLWRSEFRVVADEVIFRPFQVGEKLG